MAKKNDVADTDMYRKHPMLPINGGVNIKITDGANNRGQFVIPRSMSELVFDLESPEGLSPSERTLIGRYCFACFSVLVIQALKLPEQMQSPANGVWGTGWLAWSLGQKQYDNWLKRVLTES